MTRRKAVRLRKLHNRAMRVTKHAASRWRRFLGCGHVTVRVTKRGAGIITIPAGAWYVEGPPPRFVRGISVVGPTNAETPPPDHSSGGAAVSSRVVTLSEMEPHANVKHT
jgi:hypothetical protein